jgi:hypothetical protein
MVNDARGPEAAASPTTGRAPNCRYATLAGDGGRSACYIETVAPVCAGEELLADYGASYWLDKTRRGAAGPR